MMEGPIPACVHLSVTIPYLAGIISYVRICMCVWLGTVGAHCILKSEQPLKDYEHVSTYDGFQEKSAKKEVTDKLASNVERFARAGAPALASLVTGVMQLWWCGSRKYVGLQVLG